MKLDFRQRLLATTLLVGASMAASPAFAQTAPTPPDTAAGDQPTTAAPVANAAPPATAAPADTGRSPGDIVITGSRIPQVNLTSPAPVTVVTSQDVKLTGTTRVEDLLNQLPSVGASQASGVSNGATGTAEVDLRYLGSKRTLSLINGRRLTPGDPNSSSQAADLNLIPASLIKRVEVLTGGASSTYGADAVAGVVNFIIDTNFTGIRFDGQASFYQHDNRNPSVSGGLTMNDIAHRNGRNFSLAHGNSANGGSFDGTVSFGTAFDDGRGHAVAYVGYRKVDAVLQASRDYSGCVIQNTGGGVPRCGGSATANPGTAVIFPSTTNTSTVAALGPGTITPFAQNLYNFAPTNYFQRPDERYIGGAFANYEISPAVKPYLEFMFMDDHTVAQIAPSGDFGNTLTINCDNPLMSAAQLAVICNPNNMINGFLGNFPLAVGAPYNPNGVVLSPGSVAPPLTFFDARGNTYNEAFFQLLRRNTEGGNRQSDLEHTSYRGVLGVKGDLNKAFSYDAYYQYGKTDYSQVYRNEFSAARLGRALNVVNVDPATGAVVPVGTAGSVTECRSVLDGTDPACVPYDVFGASASAAAVNYLNVFGVIHGTTTEQIADANVTGALGEYGFQTPWSDEGVSINFGGEYRKEALHLDPDQEFQTGDLTGQGAPTLPVDGNFHVLEVFGETQIPIVRHSFIEDFTINAGYRYSAYKISSGRKYNTSTYKLGVELAPVSDIRFRASYNRAVRAPNIQELFAPQFVGLDGSVDPCAGLTDALGNPRPVAAGDFGCRAQNLAIGQSPAPNPAGQYNGLLGGEPDLNPEKATTKTIGVVLQPRFIPGFAATIDYWNIDLKNAIQGFGADAIINNCIAHTTGTTPDTIASSCALIHRNAAGSLWLTPDGFINDLPSNSGEIKTDGVDATLTYSHRLGGLGTLSTNFNGTYLHKYKVNNGLEGGIYDCAGLYGPTCSGGGVASSAPMPKWRHKMRLTLQLPAGLGFSGQWRYIGKVKAETLDPSETLTGANNFDPGLHIGAQSYFDLATTFTVGDHLNLRVGANNILDRQPPLVTSGNANRSGSNLCPAGSCNGNTYPGTYDALGRFIYAGATVSF
ncbi:MAG TPA: TonB-dependent receptor [Sphingomicrobium sp.]|nr:TonB-dependent receptor [Sphingomicrobium sp.]